MNKNKYIKCKKLDKNEEKELLERIKNAEPYDFRLLVYEEIENKEIEEILRILNEDCGECKTCGYCGLGYACTDVANSIKLYNAGYRKIDKDSVVLSREDMKKYAEDCIAGQETGLDIINALIARAERYKEKAKQTRQETAREIYEQLCGHGTTYVKKWIKERYGVEV